MEKVRRSINIRIMWVNEAMRGNAERVAKIIIEALREAGIEVRVSKVYRNRNTGGRIYLTVLP